MPGQELPIGSIRKARRERDGLTGTLVELFAIAEGAAQQRADLKVGRCGMDAQQPPVEHDVDICPQQQSVVDTVLTSRCHRFDVRSLKDRQDLRPGDRAPQAVGGRDAGFETFLTQTTPDEARCELDFLAIHPHF